MKNILLIDPDESFRIRLSRMLAGNKKYRIETGANFCEAVDKMSKEHFDCLIMSVHLPEIKGYNAVSIMRNMNPRLRIILTADRNSRSLESKVREQNVFYYYIKSFRKKELVLAISNALKDNRRKPS